MMKEDKKFKAFDERRFVNWQIARSKGEDATKYEREEKMTKEKVKSKVIKKEIPVHLRVGF